MFALNSVSNVMSFKADQFNLFPVLPSAIKDSRCQAAVRARGSSTFDRLESNLVSVPSYQSQGWTISVHPEGNPYAHIKVLAGITVVTVACISEPGVVDQLNAWFSTIVNMITEKHIHLPETSHLFLEIHKGSGSCNYYFADHTLRTVFWLHTLDTVALRPQRPNNYLQHALEENYWIHIELFPEAASQYSVQALNELQVVFLHARAGEAEVPASDTPTLPYTVKQREEILDLLERNKDQAHSPYIITYVAGLWTTVANRRFTSDEDHRHLSFGQSTLDIPDGKWSLVLAIISNTLLFGFPDEHQARLKSLWVDQIVNTRRWRVYISETVEDLRQTMLSTFALLIANVHMMPLSSFPAFSSSSLLLCVIGLVTALFLMQEQRTLLSMNAATAVVNLDNPNRSNRFRSTAAIHSLLQALFTWALLLFAMQSFRMTFADFPLPILLFTFLLVATVLVVTCGGIWKALNPRSKTFERAT